MGSRAEISAKRSRPRGPYLAVDCIIQVWEGSKMKGIVLIHRKNPPSGLALPGGFVNWGESVEEAVEREIMEETNVKLRDIRQFHVYSQPRRDERQHNVSVVFVGATDGKPIAGDDAAGTQIVPLEKIPFGQIVFDHAQILRDFLMHRYPLHSPVKFARHTEDIQKKRTEQDQGDKPHLTVDGIVQILEEVTEDGKTWEAFKGIVLITRKKGVAGKSLALPGGFVEYGESLEDAVIREVKEETTLQISAPVQFRTYSNPERDMRPGKHNVSIVFLATATGVPKGEDDAVKAGIYPVEKIPWDDLAFDHKYILKDFVNHNYGGGGQ